jgi:hypothetical protein
VTTFADLKRVTDSVNGVEERGGPSGHDGNIIFVWDELQPDFNGQPYCAGGVSWTWKHAGHPFPAIDHPWGFSYCPDAVNWFKNNHLWDASGHYEPGDTLFFQWNLDGVADHTGIVIADNGSMIHTFEFNTSPPGGGGDQANGGGCYYRDRPHGNTILGVGKSSRWLNGHPSHTPAPRPAPHRVLRANPYHVPDHGLPLREGYTGNAVRFIQWAVGAPIDGQWGPTTTHYVKVFQKYKGIVADGVVGKQTLSAMQRVTR